MSDKNKKPSAMLQHQPKAKPKTGTGVPTNIVPNSPPKANMLTNLIPLGEENKVSTSDLVRRVGCKTSRELRALIESARNQGAVICASSTGGYFLPTTKDELRRHVHTVDARAVNSLKSNTSARRMLEQMEETTCGNNRNT